MKKNKKERPLRVMTTGGNGGVGQELRKLLQNNPEFVDLSTGRPNTGRPGPTRRLDITDSEEVTRFIRKNRPDVVIHCAAWTNVDEAEELVNYNQVLNINAWATSVIADACRHYGAKMIYISTDYVFDGKGIKPWHPDCKDFGPLNKYGETKLRGEELVESSMDKFFIVRTSWIFGPHKNNFVKTIYNLGKTHKKLDVVDDQIGMLTYAEDLAKLLLEMAQSEEYGYYHATNSGTPRSWADFAEEIFEVTGMKTKINRVRTADYKRAVAKRPLNSRLDISKLPDVGFNPLPSYKDALRRYLSQLE